jgi:hypothetical protein
MQPLEATRLVYVIFTVRWLEADKACDNCAGGPVFTVPLRKGGMFKFHFCDVAELYDTTLRDRKTFLYNGNYFLNL